jgi:hypothetical protein
MIRVVDTLAMIEFATQRNFDRHDMYLITMWFVIVMKECKDQLHCNVQTLKMVGGHLSL